MKIIIIGNGPSAVRKENGEFIDGCDKVARINDYEISGYEKYVGRKTDIWTRADLLRKKNYLEEREKVVDQVLYCIPLQKYRLTQFENLPSKYVIPSRETMKKLYEDSEYQYIDSLAPGVYWPSTGLIAIAHFLERKEYEKPIYIVGFDNFSLVNGYPRWYHDKDFEIVLERHKGLQEKRYIDKRVQEGALVRL